MAKKREQETCNCEAYPFPHRLGGGKCEAEEWFCAHGIMTHHHPEWDGEGCLDCRREEYADYVYDNRRMGC